MTTTDTGPTTDKSPTTDTSPMNGAVAHEPAFNVGSIHPGELRRLRDADPNTLILDVRTAAEFESVHIPGSYNVPLDLLSEHVDDIAQLEHTVVPVCQSGNRASTAQKKLTAAGKSTLRVLDGGIGAWQSTHGDVVTGQQKWTLDRQVRGVAGTIVLASVLVGLKAPPVRLVAAGVGFGLALSALTNSCAMGTLLAKLPYNSGPRCNVDDVLARMRG